jgi:alkanesulfonate monooxygenase SsuD/methylene tetrahydromethanopterin reductase-like flavin-dependent oxidoreductase (luciferase family)
MSLKYGLFLSQGFALELAGIKDPVEAYETLTRWAQTADQSGYDSVWIPARASAPVTRSGTGYSGYVDPGGGHL